MQPVGNRFNILATRGDPRVLLTTHMDTVPGQLPIRENKDTIFGRGSCDAKGIIASMICACERAADEGFENFGILIDVGEESDFCGIQQAVELVNPAIVIVGEPTELKLVYGQKGLLGFKLRCTGRSAPGATPEQGLSAINKLVQKINKLQELQLPSDSSLGASTMNIGLIKGGSAPNVVPDRAEALVEIRTTTQNRVILRMVQNAAGAGAVTVDYSFEPVVLSDLQLFDTFSYEKITVPYFTEMYFWTKKAKTVVFGPGAYKFAHTDKEQVTKRDLLKGEQAYFNMIQLFSSRQCSSTSTHSQG